MGKRRAELIKGLLICIVVIFVLVILQEDTAAKAEETKISVSLSGNAVYQNFFNGMADVIITVRERFLDKNSLSVVIQNETGREVRIVYDEEWDAWKNLDAFGEDMIEAVPYENAMGNTLLWDSEEGEELYTDNREIKMCFRFPEEGDYKITEISCSDLAGNVSKLENAADFSIDKTAPVTEVELLSEGTRGREGYYDRPVTVWFYLKEHNFCKDKSSKKPQIFIKQGEMEEKLFSGEIEWNAAPERGTDWFKAAVACTEDSFYTWRISYEDPAGWQLSDESRKECTFTVDKTAPDYGRIQVLGKTWGSFLEKVTFGLFAIKEEAVILEGGDSVSPIEPLQYYCSAQELSKEELEILPEEVWKTGNSFFLEPDSKVIIYLKVTNYAGLSGYFSSDGIILENRAVDIELTAYGDRASESGIYRSDVRVEILLKEAGETGVYSGIKKAGYHIENSESGILLDESDIVLNPAEWMGSLIIPAENHMEETVRLTVWAEDYAGNYSEENAEYVIDKISPAIGIEFDENTPLNGRYFSQSRTASVKIRDQNFEEELVQFQITNSEGVMPEISKWDLKDGFYQCQVKFSADGDYIFSVKCRDRAGNASEKYGGEFTVDQTPPQITITFDDKESGKGQFYRTDRKAEITVKEHNFHKEGLSEKLVSLLEAQGKEFTHNGDIHSLQLEFTEEGRHELQMEFADLAGNTQAGNGFWTEFFIDKTMPEIEIEGIEDKSANRGEVETQIICRDEYLDTDSCSIKLFKLDKMGNQIKENTDGMIPEPVTKIMEDDKRGIKEQWFAMADFPYDPKTDGMYMLEAVCRDIAGNQMKRQTRFSVNRYGSVYMADEDTRDWLHTKSGKYPYVKEERDLVVLEYNVDAVKEYQITAYHDGTLRILKENEDYSRRKLTKTGQERWQIYEYRIDKKNFEKEGDYEILLYSEDAAGNYMENVSAKLEEREAVFKFSIDKTGPVILLSGAEDGGRYDADNLQLYLNIQDNMAIRRAEVCLGDVRELYEGERIKKEIEEKDGNLELNVKAREDWQKIKILAEDEAGNQEIMEWNIMVKKEEAVQHRFIFMSLYLTAGGIGGIILAMWLAGHRRKNKI